MNERPFQLVILTGLLTILPIAAYFRIRSQIGGEKLDRLQEGWPILLGIRLPALAHALGLITYAINPALMTWSQIAIPDWLRWLGLPLGVGAGGLLLWAMRSLGKNLTDTVVVRRGATLVRHGPYRYVRHPFYVAMFLTFQANFWLTANLFLLGSGMVVLFFIYQRTTREEANLIERFGDTYRAYAAATPRFIPKWS